MNLPMMSSIQPQTFPARGGAPQARAGEKATVVGAGLAGCAAAVALAERGVAVTLLEREDQLGGRVSGWTDALSNGRSFEMERGFHAFFRQYYNLRDFIRRIDPPLASLTPLTDYPLLGPGGRSESFAGLPQKPPMNLVSLVMRTPTLGLRDMVDIPTGPALDMMAYDETTTFSEYDEVSAGDFLDGLCFPDEARQMLFDIFATPSSTLSTRCPQQRC